MRNLHTRNTLLGNDQVRLDSENSIAHSLDLLLLNLQNAVPVILLGNLNIGLRLALFVLERAVEEHNTGVLYAPAHLGVCDILVEHQTVEDLAVLNFAAGDLFDTGVALDIDLGVAVASLHGDGANGSEGQLAHLVHPAGDKLGTDGGGNELAHGRVVVDVDGVGDLFDDFEGILEGALKGRDDDDGVDVALELGEGLGEDFTSYRRKQVLANFLIFFSAFGFCITSNVWNRLNVPRMMTVVVPSPTSSSCVRLSSIMLLAAGWETSISRRMA